MVNTYFYFGLKLLRSPRADEYNEDQLNVADKNLTKYPLNDKIGKIFDRYFLHERLQWRKCYFELFSRHHLTALHTKFHSCQTPPFFET